MQQKISLVTRGQNIQENEISLSLFAFPLTLHNTITFIARPSILLHLLCFKFIWSSNISLIQKDMYCYFDITICNKQMVPWNDIISCWWLLAFDLSFFSCVFNVSYFNTLTHQIIYIFTQCVWAWLTRQIKWFNKINNLSKSIIASINFDIIFACQSASLISWHIPKDL